MANDKPESKWYFRETQNQSYYMDFRLFIEGAEVTRWVQESVSWTIAGTDNMNTLNFTLANAEDIWLLTAANLQKENPQWRKTNDYYDESPKRDLWQRKSARNKKIGPDERGIYVYPLFPFTPVFHTHDTVRLFVRNPCVPGDWWMPAFCGFLERHPLTEDYINGNRPLSFTCYDIKGLMKRMRVNINPLTPSSQQQDKSGKKDRKQIGELVGQTAVMDHRAGMYEDLMQMEGLNHVLAQGTFEDKIRFLFLGEGALQTVGDGKQTMEIHSWLDTKPDEKGSYVRSSVTTEIKVGEYHPDENETCYQPAKLPIEENWGFKRGHIGRLRFGRENVYYYPDPRITLEQWHNLCLFGTKSNRYLTEAEVTTWGRNSVSENLPGSPYNGQIYLLLPDKGTQANTFVQTAPWSISTEDFQNGFNFETKFDLVNQLCSVIDYQWTVTPKGDIVFEFPMFDFNPNAFDKHQKVFEANLHLSQANLEDEAADTPTAIIATGTEQTAGAESVSAKGKPYAPGRDGAYSWTLAQRLGANVEIVTAPVGIGATVGNSQKGQEALSTWVKMQFQKRLGQSSTMSFSLPFRPWLFPNRPLEHMLRKRVGLASGITHNLQDGSACSTDTTMNYVRTLYPDDPPKGKGGFKYRYMSTGGENMPISYSTLFTNTGDVLKTGVGTVKNVNPGDSSGTQPVMKDKYSAPPNSDLKEDYKKEPKLKELRPEFQQIVADILRALRKRGFQPKIRSGYRSQQDQDKLVARGGTPARKSYHSQGLAVDIFDNDSAHASRGWPFANEHGKGGTQSNVAWFAYKGIPYPSEQFYKALGEEAMTRGLRWGGDNSSKGFARQGNQGITNSFKTYGMGWDPVHIDWGNAPSNWKDPNSGEAPPVEGKPDFQWPISSPSWVGKQGTAASFSGRYPSGKPHGALDMGKAGDAVLATADGTVKEARDRKNAAGIAVVLDLGNKWVAIHYHLASFSVVKGQKVSAGQQIGVVGATGLPKNNPHLHFEVRHNNTMIDPVALLPGSTQPKGTAVAKKTTPPKVVDKQIAAQKRYDPTGGGQTSVMLSKLNMEPSYPRSLAPKKG